MHPDTLSPQLLIRALARARSRPAVTDGDRTWTAAALADEISRYAQAYDAWGIGVGTPIATLAGNRVEVLFQIGANMVTGARATALHPLGSLDDHAYILEDAGIETLFYDPGVYEARAFDLAARVPTVKRLVALGPGAQSEDLPSAAGRFGPRALSAPDVHPDDAYQVAYTGGTTGKPKGVVGTWRSQVTLTTILLAEWDWPEHTRFLCCTPLSHAGRVAFLPTLMREGTFVVLPGFDPERVLDAIARQRITTTLLVPTMIYRLLDQAGPGGADLSSLQRIYYGASAMSPTRLREGIERFGPVFFQFYGQAECPMTVSVLRPSEHDVDRPERLASCGRPVPWLDVALLDDDGRPAGPGEAAEICVRGPLVMKEYLNQPELTAEALRGGWLHTGDVARADDEGYLTIVDRRKDIVISGGFNVYPREVEDVVSSHPGVAAVAVIGVPDQEWGEAVKAVVVRRPGGAVTGDELIALVRERKGKVNAPKSVDFVDEIPLSPLGKPDKKALRAAYWPSDGRQVN
ncbi:MAG TPA: AMP-binding protein [Acidimicrobiia bacterium]|nr:AMP-binding protein [Acidimicrobiia bacterium]